MAISRKRILKNIAGLQENILYHLDEHIPALLSGANCGLLRYWRKEVGARIAEMEEWAGRLPQNDEQFRRAAEYHQRLTDLIAKRLRDLGESSL